MFIHENTDNSTCTVPIEWFLVEGRSLYEAATYMQQGRLFAGTKLIGSSLFVGIYNNNLYSFRNLNKYYLTLKDNDDNILQINLVLNNEDYIAEWNKAPLESISEETWFKLLKRKTPPYTCPSDEDEFGAIYEYDYTIEDKYEDYYSEKQTLESDLSDTEELVWDENYDVYEEFETNESD